MYLPPITLPRLKCTKAEIGIIFPFINGKVRDWLGGVWFEEKKIIIIKFRVNNSINVYKRSSKLVYVDHIFHLIKMIII